MASTRDFIDELTAQLRVGRRGWDDIRPHVTRYALPGSQASLYDWDEIRRFIQRTAQPQPPSEKRAAS